MLAYNDNISEEISTMYADMMSHMFPELKEKHEYNNLKARANNVIHVILEKYHLVSNDKLYEIYKNFNNENGIQTMEMLFGKPVMDYLAETKDEEMRTRKKVKWVRHVKK